jgi:hypothetical protein
MPYTHNNTVFLAQKNALVTDTESVVNALLTTKNTEKTPSPFERDRVGEVKSYGMKE